MQCGEVLLLRSIPSLIIRTLFAVEAGWHGGWGEEEEEGGGEGECLGAWP